MEVRYQVTNSMQGSVRSGIWDAEMELWEKMRRDCWMPRRGRGGRGGRARENTYQLRPRNPYVPYELPSGVPVPMCFCGDPCKVEVSEEELTYMQRYWMCANFSFDPPPSMVRAGLMTPPPLCDFQQWIDTEISERDKRIWDSMKQFDAEMNERLEMRRKQEAERKQREEELERARAAKSKEERDKKLERVRRAKEALEENPDALRKGKWPRCTQ